jgi:hypothetical protein
MLSKLQREGFPGPLQCVALVFYWVIFDGSLLMLKMVSHYSLYSIVPHFVPDTK